MIRFATEYGVFRRLSNLLAIIFLWVGPAQAEPLRLVALGDSLTQGYGLAPEDGFVPQLQAWLDGQGLAVEVVNAGVSGDTTAGGLERVNWVLAGGADGLIVALGGNDMLRGFPPEQTRANLEAIIQAALGRDIPVMLIGVEASNNYGPSYKAAFDGNYTDLAQHYGLPLVPSFLSAIAEGRTLEEMRGLMQNDGLHPNAQGVELIVAEVGPEVAAWLSTLP